MNKVCITGNICQTPDFMHTQNGVAICKFTLGNNRGYGEKRKTIFVNIVTFNKTAENCEKYLSKGSKVAIVGELEIRQYTDNNGENKYITEIIANEVEFLSTKTSNIVENSIEVMDDLPF